MRQVTEFRNAAEHLHKELDPDESEAVHASWRVVQTWAESRK